MKISEPHDIADLDALDIELLDPLPDGRFLIAQREESEIEAVQVNVVLNWFDELRRLASN